MTDKTRATAMMWGGLVADAATMGVHWLYDQPRIRQIAPDAPEFLAPLVENFAGFPGYFAHATRTAGELSQYGEQQLVMLQSLAATSGYDRADYQARFRAFFGYGGGYVGYIDRPTRDTLDNITAMEKEALVRSRAVDPSVDTLTHGKMVTKVLANTVKHKGEKLRSEVEFAVRETHDDDAMVAYALKIADIVTESFDFPGADDTQLPALAKLPVLVARHGADANLMEIVEDAVRVTNNNDIAVSFAKTAAALLLAVLQTGKMPDLSALIEDADPVVKSCVQAALARTDETTQAVTADIGMSCNLDLAVLSIFHNLATASGYIDGVRTNIYAGGDNCGRSIVIGSVLGAIHGVPQDWTDRVARKDDIATAITATL